MPTFIWALFLLLIGAILVFDLLFLTKSGRALSVKEAIGWSLFWVFLALLFNAFVYFIYEYKPFGLLDPTTAQKSGLEASLEFFTGYLLEKSLSLDNLFVIAMIFKFYGIPMSMQHRVLTWGVAGAVVLRGAMILGGIALIELFEWMVYVFGLILFFSAIKMLTTNEETLDPNKVLLIRLTKKIFPVTPSLVDEHFFVKTENKWMMTPLFLAMLQVETADVIFAVDSIPAILAITRDPFIVFTSNIFAILGLRALYFLLAHLMEQSDYLRYSLAFIIAFIGIKMMLVDIYEIPIAISLTFIVGLLMVGLLPTIFTPKKQSK